MLINNKTGKIAYHSFILQEQKGEFYTPMKFVQYDFDGKELDRLLTSNEESIEI